MTDRNDARLAERCGQRYFLQCGARSQLAVKNSLPQDRCHLICDTYPMNLRSIHGDFGYKAGLKLREILNSIVQLVKC